MIPKRKIVEFIDWINHILVEYREEDLPIPTLENEANKIRPYSYPDWKMALGMIEGLKYNSVGVDQHFQAAIKGGGDRLVYSNYASACHNISLNLKSYEIMENALEVFNNHPTLMRDAAELYIDIHNYERAQVILNSLHDIIKEDTAKEMQGKINLLKSLYTSNNVTWQDTSRKLQRAREFISSKTNNLKKITESVGEDYIFYEFLINDEIEKIAEIEISLHDFFAAEEYSPIDSLVSFAITKP